MRYLVVAFSLICSGGLMAEVSTAPVKGWDSQSFLQKLQTEIQKQEQRVNQAKDQALSTKTIATTANVNQFTNAYEMLNVKQTLYANFKDNPVTESPAVQAKLLQIFQKDLITPGDLADLQAVANLERPKYVAPATSPAGQ